MQTVMCMNFHEICVNLCVKGAFASETRDNRFTLLFTFFNIAKVRGCMSFNLMGSTVVMGHALQWESLFGGNPNITE